MEIDQGVDLDNPMQQALENIPLTSRCPNVEEKSISSWVCRCFGKSLGKFLRMCLIHLFFSTPHMVKFYVGRPQKWGKWLLARATTVEELNKRVEKLWQLDSFPRDDSESKLTMDEIAAVESMEKNLKLNKETGRCRTRLL